MELAGFEHFSILGGFGTYEVQIALCYALAHFVLRFALKPIWGDKRNSVAVMGGSDGARGDAKFSAKDLAKRSLTIDVVAYNMIAVSYAVYCAVTGPMGWLDGSAAKVEGSPTDRLYAESSGAMALASLTGLWSGLQRAAGATQRLFEIIETVPAIASPEAPAPFPAEPRRIAFEGVRFTYPSRPDEEVRHAADDAGEREGRQPKVPQQGDLLQPDRLAVAQHGRHELQHQQVARARRQRDLRGAAARWSARRRCGAM